MVNSGTEYDLSTFEPENQTRASSDTYHSGIHTSPQRGARLDMRFTIPLGVFAMLVAGWHIQTRAAIAHMEALSRERIAAIEKGIPPEREPEPPKPPARAG